MDDRCQLGPVPTCTVRNNRDTHVNRHGRELLRLCQRTGLRIVNGRVAAFTYECYTADKELKIQTGCCLHVNMQCMERVVKIIRLRSALTYSVMGP